MFKKIFSKPLRLVIDDKLITFNSLDDFEFALSTRSEVPWKRVTDSFKRSDSELEREAEGIKQAEKRFVDILTKTMETETTLGKHVKKMEVKLFSQDHQWRSIMSALNNQDPEYDEFKRRALIKYMQYLTSRQDVVQKIFSDRKQHERAQWESNSGHAESPDSPLKETIIFDLTRISPSPSTPKKEKFTRMPKGEAVEIPLTEGDKIPILVSKHRFYLISSDQYYLEDDNGTDYPLHQGKNTIGRDAANDVSVNPAYRDVSRKHLIIDVDAQNPVLITDLSSHGTFLSPLFIENTTGTVSFSPSKKTIG